MINDEQLVLETADCKTVTIHASEYARLKKLDENVRNRIEQLRKSQGGQTNYIKHLIQLDICKIESLYDE